MALIEAKAATVAALVGFLWRAELALPPYPLLVLACAFPDLPGGIILKNADVLVFRLWPGLRLLIGKPRFLALQEHVFVLPLPINPEKINADLLLFKPGIDVQQGGDVEKVLPAISPFLLGEAPQRCHVAPGQGDFRLAQLFVPLLDLLLMQRQLHFGRLLAPAFGLLLFTLYRILPPTHSRN